MHEISWNGYNVKRLSYEQLNSLAVLYLSVYGRASIHEYFPRKYNTAFTGVLYTGYIAYDKQNLPVAFYGVIPCFIHYGNDKILAAQSADTMTHPAHRNKGLFVELANLTVTLCRYEGIRILFGFPNQHSLPGFVGKLQWQLTGYMARFMLPVRTLPLEHIALKFPALKGVYNWFINYHLKQYKLSKQALANTFSTQFAGVYRDDDYIKYKSYNYTTVVNIHGAILWFKVKNGLTVGDITISEDFEKVVASLKNLVRKLGIRQIVFQVSEDTPLYWHLLEYAEPTRGFPVIVKDLGSGIPTDKIKFTFADIDIF